MCVHTEEIRLQIITTAKKFSKFSPESPYTSNMFSRESPKFQTRSHVSKRSPCPSLSKSLGGKLIDLEIQIFKSDLLRERDVWSELCVRVACVRVVCYMDECFVYSELRVCVRMVRTWSDLHTERCVC